MSPAGLHTTLLLLVTFSFAHEKDVLVNAQCEYSYSEDFKPVQITVAENADCSWDIFRPANDTTRVIFSLLDLNPTAHCSQENITVLDQDLRVLGVLCPGSPKIAVFESPGEVYIRTYTDSTSYARRAYFLYYSLTKQNDIPCGGKLSGYSGTISTPNYPNRHDPFTLCIWNLEAPKNTKVKLKFTEIFTEPDAACRFDFIAVYDGPDTDSKLMEVLCGRMEAELETTSNYLTLLFSADYANSYFGFSAKYTALPENDNSTLACSGDSMTVILNPGFINSLGYTANELTLIDKTCHPQSDDPILFEVPYETCGTIKKVVDHTIYYTNTIYASQSEGVITRRRELQVILTCELDSNSTVEIMYVTEIDIIQSQQESGKYNVSLAFYDNNSPSKDLISTEPDAPYFIELNDKVYLQATVKSQDSDLTVFIDTCFASPASNFHPPTYDLIRSGCIQDDTYKDLGSGSRFARFSFNAFKFLNETSSIYLQCQVVVCDSRDTESRCNQGCVTRQRRELGSTVWKSNAVLGPIRLKRHSESDAAGSVSEKRDVVKTDQSSVYFVGIPVLVVNVLIIALVLTKIYRKEPTGYRYQPVPMQ